MNHQHLRPPARNISTSAPTEMTDAASTLPSAEDEHQISRIFPRFSSSLQNSQERDEDGNELFPVWKQHPRSCPDRWSAEFTASRAVQLVDMCPDRWSCPSSSKNMPSPKCILDHSAHHLDHDKNEAAVPSVCSNETSTTAACSTSTAFWSQISQTESCEEATTAAGAAVKLLTQKLLGRKKARTRHTLVPHDVDKRRGSPHRKGMRRYRLSSPAIFQGHEDVILQPDTKYVKQKNDSSKFFEPVNNKARSRKSLSRKVESAAEMQAPRHQVSPPLRHIRRQKVLSAIPSWEDLQERRSRRAVAKDLEESLFRGEDSPRENQGMVPLSPPPPLPRRLSSLHKRPGGRKHVSSDRTSHQRETVDGHVIQSPRGTCYCIRKSIPKPPIAKGASPLRNKKKGPCDYSAANEGGVALFPADGDMLIRFPTPVNKNNHCLPPNPRDSPKRTPHYYIPPRSSSSSSSSFEQQHRPSSAAAGHSDTLPPCNKTFVELQDGIHHHQGPSSLLRSNLIRRGRTARTQKAELHLLPSNTHRNQQ